MGRRHTGRASSTWMSPYPCRHLTVDAPWIAGESLQVGHVAPATREFPPLPNLAGHTPMTVTP